MVAYKDRHNTAENEYDLNSNKSFSISTKAYLKHVIKKISNLTLFVTLGDIESIFKLSVLLDD